MSFGLMPFDFFQNAMYLAMLEEAESGKAGTQPVKEYSSNRPKKSECFASAFLFSDFFGMFPCLKKSRGSGQSPVFITAINFVIFEKLLSRDFTSLTFVSLIISILPQRIGKISLLYLRKPRRRASPVNLLIYWLSIPFPSLFVTLILQEWISRILSMNCERGTLLYC